MVQRDRLWMLAAPAIVLAGCEQTVTQTKTKNTELGDLVSANPSEVTFPSQAPTPQFLLGSRKAPKLVEVGFSLHCGASRNWFRQNFPALSRATASGQKAAMFSHVVRTDAEMAAGKVIMGVDPDRYGDAMMAVLAFTMSENRALSASEIASFLPAAGYPRSGSANDKSAEFALTAVRAGYEAVGLKGTPYVKEIPRS